MSLSLTSLNIDKSSYYITVKVPFNPIIKFSNDILRKVFKFSYDMTFGKIGEHRTYRSGGQYSRKNGELFINTFQGKLAEFGIYQFLSDNNLSNCEEPDLSKWKLGKWDSTDLVYNDIKINIKSTKFYGNLFLLETKDWDSSGVYKPNVSKDGGIYDIFILSRISPDGDKLMKSNRLFYSNEITQGPDLLWKVISEENWSYDIPGFIKHIDLLNVIKNKFILPQNSLLNGKIPMDAENYYVQSGDMYPHKELLKIIS